MTKFKLLFIIAAVCFFIGIIDDLFRHAANFNEFNLLGKICCVGVVACIAGWVIILITENIRK